MILAFFIILGLILGSFLNVCIYRIPRGIFWQSTRSVCPHCQKVIPFYHNIPVLSYLVLLGKSSCCQKKILLQYPIVELLVAMVFIVLIEKFPFVKISSEGLLLFHGFDFYYFLHAALFLMVMIVCAVIDFNHMIIPDKISLPMILLSPLAAWLHPALSFKSSVLGVLLGGGVIYFVAWGYFLLRRREGIGMGDAKLLAAIGGWLGYEAVFPTLFLGSVSGSIIGVSCLLVTRKFSLKAEIPFGPFLVLGASFYLLFPVEWLDRILI